ncbi:MAG: hypothetical protein BGO34_10805 [Bacteroidia bacterium 44-10]|jgi:hypothetical protein|nr:MAG: hypothetical protein BGO34_10805 [Bacteroidia bacterium 44-10]
MIKLKVKKLCVIAFAALTLTACDLFKIDNYDGPNASFNGGIKDIKTGELVETDIQNGSRLQFQELGYPTGLLTRVVMQDGQFRDDMFFAGRYSIDFNACNFYPFKIEEIEVKKGNNTMDFEVTPYIRVQNVNIKKEGNTIVATFNLEAGKDEVRLSNVQLYAHTDIYVGDQITTYTPGGSGFRQSFSPVKVIDPSETYTLTIDLTNEVNANYFKYDRNYYFRVGAMASVSGVGTIRRNYAPYTVIKFSVP